MNPKSGPATQRRTASRNPEPSVPRLIPHPNSRLATLATYPIHWPRPNRHKDPNILINRITEAQKVALYAREATTRALAKTLGVSEKFLSATFPGKVPIVDKSVLISARRQYRSVLAQRVLNGEISVRQASEIAFCSYNTIKRAVQRLEAAQK